MSYLGKKQYRKNKDEKEEKEEIENLCNERARLVCIVTHFKNTNEEYGQIKQAVEENVKDI
jgi:hypothetical protein